MLLDSEGIDAYDQASATNGNRPGIVLFVPTCARHKEACHCLGSCCNTVMLAAPVQEPSVISVQLSAGVIAPNQRWDTSDQPHDHTLVRLLLLQTAQYSTQIFSLAVLLSSLFVYNQMGGIDEAALDRCAPAALPQLHMQCSHPAQTVAMSAAVMPSS